MRDIKKYLFLILSISLLFPNEKTIVEDKDITLLIHENMFNNLFSKPGSVEKKVKKWKVRMSNLNFQFNDGYGQLNVDIRIRGKKKIISVTKKITVNMKLRYDFNENLIILDVDKVKINFGKLIGDLDFSKLLEVEDYVFSVPEIESKPMLINDVLIRPTITDAEATFVEDAIKLAYKIEYKE